MNELMNLSIGSGNSKDLEEYEGRFPCSASAERHPVEHY